MRNSSHCVYLLTHEKKKVPISLATVEKVSLNRQRHSKQEQKKRRHEIESERKAEEKLRSSIFFFFFSFKYFVIDAQEREKSEESKNCSVCGSCHGVAEEKIGGGASPKSTQCAPHTFSFYVAYAVCLTFFFLSVCLGVDVHVRKQMRTQESLCVHALRVCGIDGRPRPFIQ